MAFDWSTGRVFSCRTPPRYNILRIRRAYVRYRCTGISLAVMAVIVVVSGASEGRSRRRPMAADGNNGEKTERIARLGQRVISSEIADWMPRKGALVRQGSRVMTQTSFWFYVSETLASPNRSQRRRNNCTFDVFAPCKVHPCYYSSFRACYSYEKLNNNGLDSQGAWPRVECGWE